MSRKKEALVGEGRIPPAACGWTNRYLTEAAFRMCSDPRLMKPGHRRRGFVLVPCWASETYTPEAIRAETRAALYRHAHLARHGAPRTLGEIMRLDGAARAFGGMRPALSGDELEYTRAVIRPHLGRKEFPLQFACLFGDTAARDVGYPPQGLSPYAGFERALWQALNGPGDDR